MVYSTNNRSDQSHHASTYQSGEVGKFGITDRLFSLIAYHCCLIPHPTMAGSDTHLKSLKLFKLILRASETEYRDSSPADRGPVFKLLIGEIHDAAQELNLTVGDDRTLRNVSTSVLHSTHVAPNVYVVGCSKSFTGISTTDQSLRKRQNPLSKQERIGPPPCCRLHIP